MPIVRPATPEDHPALAEIFLSSRRHAFPWCDPASFVLNDFAAQTEGEIIQLAEEEDGTPLGFISVWEPEAFIHHLFVDPRHLGRGIGGRLVDSLHAWLPLPWRLKCKTANLPALGFYLRRGWRELSRVEDVSGQYALMEFGPPAGPLEPGENPAS
ncbi:MAG: GNAT family N-acetyltransferase [Verrucomicrobiota bacterium]